MYPGHWDVLCAGHVMSGGNYISTAIRELKEEFGISAKPSQLIALEMFVQHGRDKKRKIVNNEFTKVFLLFTHRKIHGLRLQKEEVAAAKFMNIGKLEAMLKKKNSGMKFWPRKQYYLHMIGRIKKRIRKISKKISKKRLTTALS
jgi:isopentenyldiphosphate isomerase